MLLQEAGFRKVYCSDIEPKRLEIVQRFGGIPVITGKIGFLHFSLWKSNVSVIKSLDQS